MEHLRIRRLGNLSARVGRVVSRLRPLPRSDDPIARLETKGKLAQRSTGDLLDLGPPLELPLAKPLSQLLEDMRAERL